MFGRSAARDAGAAPGESGRTGRAREGGRPRKPTPAKTSAELEKELFEQRFTSKKRGDRVKENYFERERER